MLESNSGRKNCHKGAHYNRTMAGGRRRMNRYGGVGAKRYVKPQLRLQLIRLLPTNTKATRWTEALGHKATSPGQPLPALRAIVDDRHGAMMQTRHGLSARLARPITVAEGTLACYGSDVQRAVVFPHLEAPRKTPRSQKATHASSRAPIACCGEHAPQSRCRSPRRDPVEGKLGHWQGKRLR